MFGHDNISWTPINNLLMAEMKTFNATSFDVEPTAGNEGKYNDAKWYSSTDSYWVQYEGNTGRSNSGKTSASDLTNWLSNVLTMSKGQGITFSELSPADAGNDTGTGTGTGTGTSTAKDCPNENREAGATDTECGDCLSGFTANATGVCVADVADVADDETETETNWLIYGVIGVALIGGIFFLK